jgi:NTP pyrophosphatase (non-canonical NTP hydrolase)
MNFNEYQQLARKTQLYGKENPQNYVIYPALGLGGESGEVLEHIKKILRDDKRQITPERQQKLKKELGDVLWYLSNLAYDLALNLDDIATTNILKLQKRKEQNQVHGEGSDREDN